MEFIETWRASQFMVVEGSEVRGDSSREVSGRSQKDERLSDKPESDNSSGASLLPKFEPRTLDDNHPHEALNSIFQAIPTPSPSNTVVHLSSTTSSPP